MTISDFYQLSVGIFAALASIMILMLIILLIWSTLRIKTIYKYIFAAVRKFDKTAENIEAFADRNIDYIEMLKAKFESHGLLKTLISLFLRKKQGADYAEDD